MTRNFKPGLSPLRTAQLQWPGLTVHTGSGCTLAESGTGTTCDLLRLCSKVEAPYQAAAAAVALASRVRVALRGLGFRNGKPGGDDWR